MIPFLNRGGIAPHSTKRLVELGEEYVIYNGGRPGAMTNKIKLIPTYTLTRNFSIVIQSALKQKEARESRFLPIKKRKTIGLLLQSSSINFFEK